MAPASGCTTSNLGSPPLTSCCTCRRSVRFNCSPFRKRSNADIFRFAFDFTIAMSYTLCFEICQARLSWRVRHKLSDGVEWAFAGSQLATKPKIATTEVMLSDGHKGTKDGNDHSLPPGIRLVCHDPTPPSFLAHKTSTSSKQNRFQVGTQRNHQEVVPILSQHRADLLERSHHGEFRSTGSNHAPQGIRVGEELRHYAIADQADIGDMAVFHFREVAPQPDGPGVDRGHAGRMAIYGGVLELQ